MRERMKRPPVSARKQTSVSVPRFLVTAAGAAVALTGCQGHQASQERTVQIFDAADRVPAPGIEGPALSGGVINVRDFAGHVVVLNHARLATLHR